MDEFTLIRRYFNRTPRNAPALLGVGDDAALWRPTLDADLAVAADMLVADRHFHANDDAFDIAFKALAVNVSDMAAMGALPRAVTLCLALPDANETWLDGFARGFWTVADRYDIDLIGGDTTRGPLTIAVQIWGELPRGQSLRRTGAKPGDDIWVSGALGSAAAGLVHLHGELVLDDATRQVCLERLRRPEPRVELGRALIGVACSAIDISDGLLADLGHILSASGCGARLDYALVPLVPGLDSRRHDPQVQAAALTGGDDYELCFTAGTEHRSNITQLGRELGVRLTRIGTITGTTGLDIQGEQGERLQFGRTGYNHFASENS